MQHQSVPRGSKLAQCLLIGWVVALGGCGAQQPQAPLKSEMVELDRMAPRHLLEQAKRRPEPGPPPFGEQMAPLSHQIDGGSVLFTLVFDKAPLGDVIAAITRESDYNLSIEAEVDLSKPVTVNLKNATLAEALDMVVVSGAGYAWAMENHTLAIKRFLERIYHFDCLDLIGETQIEVGGDMLGSGVENSGVSGKYQIKTEKPSKSSDLWQAVEEALNGLKSAEGALRLSRNAGIIYMADTPRRVSAMVRFLDSLMESLNRQVFIEARIMEVTLSNANKYGIDWSQLGIGFTDDSGLLPNIFELAFNQGGDISKGGQSRFQVLLDFLKTQGDVKVLSSPHLTVMNRQSALLTVGFQFPYADVEGVDRDTETGLITIGTSIRRAVLGLQLGLTAQISADGMITFHIVPTLTRIQREVDVEIPLGATTQSISNPVIDLQELTTSVRVRDGDSFVLAGLISKIRTIDHEGLPGLGKLRFLGNLFKHQENREESSELVIVVTPYIRSGS